MEGALGDDFQYLTGLTQNSVIRRIVHERVSTGSDADDSDKAIYDGDELEDAITKPLVQTDSTNREPRVYGSELMMEVMAQ